MKLKRLLAGMLSVAIIFTNVNPVLASSFRRIDENLLYQSLENTQQEKTSKPQPVAHYDFDEDLLNNVSSNTLPGSIEGNGVERVNENGFQGGALKFNKVAGSYFKVDDVIDASNEDFTLSAWVKLEDGYRTDTENAHIFQQSDPGRSILFLDANNKYDTFLTGAKFNSSLENRVVADPLAWHMVSVSWKADSKEMNTYVNGEPIVSGTFTSGGVSGITDLIIGAHKDGNIKNAIKGYVDELSIYKEVLTADQVKAVYDFFAYSEETPAPEPEPEPTPGSLVAFFDFEGGITNKAEGGILTGEIVGNGVTHEADAGISGGGLKFTKQAGSHFKIPTSINASNNDFTLSAWVKYDTGHLSGNEKISIFQQNGEGRSVLYLNGSNQYGTFITGSDSVDDRAIVTSLWHHVAMSWDASEKGIKIYINGELSHEATLTGNVATATTDLLVGGHKNNNQVNAHKGNIDELRVYDTILTSAEVKEIFDVYKDHEDVEAMKPMESKDPDNLQITLNPASVIRDIPGAMFGINHRYHNDGYGTWITAEDRISPEFDAYAKEASFGSIRYPGGTVSNLFEWKKTIGPVEDRKKTINGSNFYDGVGQLPIQPNFGVDEAMTWIVDDMEAEVIWVYGMGKGSAEDAADLIEYLNAPADGDATNPNGGTDWAEIRKENGHEAPYNVTRFELGNEVGQWGQTYWMDGRNGRGIEDVYINGGLMTFGNNTKTVMEEDWRTAAANSDGTANQVKYTYYAPLTEGSVEVYAGDTKFDIVDSLEGQGQRNVCTVDYDTGRITFGDGINGNIPQQGQQIKAGYSTEQDGFIAIYDAMKAVAGEIGIEIDILAGIENKSSFINIMHSQGDDDKYDGIAIHPYSGSFGDAGAADFYENSLARTLYNNVTRVESLRDNMKNVTGEDKIVAVSEFGIYNYSHPYVKSHGHAMYIANEMIYYVNLGAEYLNKHCLVDFVSGAGTGGDSLGPAGQCVIQSVPQADGTYRHVSTPSARMFAIFNEMSGTRQIENNVTGNGIFHVHGENLPVPTVNFITTKDEEGNAYVIAVNNARKSTELDIQIERDSVSSNMADIWYITTDNERAENSLEEPDKIAVQKEEMVISGNSLTYALAPMSVTGFRIPYTDVENGNEGGDEGGDEGGNEGGNEEGDQEGEEVVSPVLSGSLDKVYDGKPVEASSLTLDTKGKKGTISYEFYSKLQGQALEEVPAAAGSYSVRAFVETEDQKTVSSNTIFFEISKASLKVSEAEVEIVSGESETSLSVKNVSFMGLQNGENLDFGTDYVATVSGNVVVPSTIAEVTVKLKDTAKSANYDLSVNTWKKEFNATKMAHKDIWVMGLEDLTYTGQKLTQNIVVYDGGKKLTEKTDYTITYKNNTNAYTFAKGESGFIERKAPQLILKMKGNYKGSYPLFFKILPVNLGDESIIIDPLTATVTDKPQTAYISVLWQGKKLKLKKDYTVTKENGDSNLKKAFTTAGTYPLIVKGSGNFTGTIETSFTITQSKKEIAMADVKVKAVKAQNYDPTGVTPKVEINNKNFTIVENEEYTVLYDKCDAAGTGYIVLDGTGKDSNGDGISFVGRKRISFKINGISMSKVKVEGMGFGFSYTGKKIEPLNEEDSKIRVTTKDGKNLVLNDDYTVTYQNNENKGTATMILTGNPKKGYTGIKKQNFKITPAVLKEDAFIVTLPEIMDVSGNTTGRIELTYTKGGTKPLVEVRTTDGSLLEEGKDYTLGYKNNKALSSKSGKPGEVIIKGKGNYSSSLTRKFDIIVKDTTVSGNCIELVAPDKVANSKKNGWKSSFKLLDSDGKPLSKQDYEVATVEYKVVSVSGNGATVKEGDILQDKSSHTLPAGTLIRVKATLRGNYKGSVSGTYRILKDGYDISKSVIKLKPQQYTGFAVEIDSNDDFTQAEMKGKGVKLYLEGDNRNIRVVEGSYEKNVKKGTAKVTFEGVGDFGGRKTVTFKIGQRTITDFFNNVFDDWNWIFN